MLFRNILMCRPAFFNVIHYKLNAHMLMHKNVNYGLANQQWANLVNNLNDCNVKVNLVKPVKNLVDMVFTANSAIIYKNKAIVSNFNAIPRKKESNYYKEYFESQKYDVHMMNYDFEGAGDGLFSHSKKHIWLGYGFRSDLRAQDEIKDIINDSNLKIHTLKLIDPLWYHLDTCFCPIDQKELILYKDAFDSESLKEIFSVYDPDDCIFVSKEDAINFANECAATVVAKRGVRTI